MSDPVVHIRVNKLRHKAAVVAIDVRGEITSLFRDKHVFYDLERSIKDGTAYFDSPDLYHFDDMNNAIEYLYMLDSGHAASFDAYCMYRPDEVIQAVADHYYDKSTVPKQKLYGALRRQTTCTPEQLFVAAAACCDSVTLKAYYDEYVEYMTKDATQRLNNHQPASMMVLNLAMEKKLIEAYKLAVNSNNVLAIDFFRDHLTTYMHRESAATWMVINAADAGNSAYYKCFAELSDTACSAGHAFGAILSGGNYEILLYYLEHHQLNVVDVNGKKVANNNDHSQSTAFPISLLECGELCGIGGNINIAKYFLSIQPELLYTSKMLMNAIRYNHIDLVRYLVDRFEEGQEYHPGSLEEVTRLGDFKILKQAIEKGMVNKLPATWMHNWYRYDDSVEYLHYMRTSGANIHYNDDMVLRVALTHPDMAVVKYILSLNEAVSEDILTLNSLALISKFDDGVAIIKRLIELGADITDKMINAALAQGKYKIAIILHIAHTRDMFNPVFMKYIATHNIAGLTHMVNEGFRFGYIPYNMITDKISSDIEMVKLLYCIGIDVHSHDDLILRKATVLGISDVVEFVKSIPNGTTQQQHDI